MCFYSNRLLSFAQPKCNKPRNSKFNLFTSIVKAKQQPTINITKVPYTRENHAFFSHTHARRKMRFVFCLFLCWCRYFSVQYSQHGGKSAGFFDFCIASRCNETFPLMLVFLWFLSHKSMMAIEPKWLTAIRAFPGIHASFLESTRLSMNNSQH